MDFAREIAALFWEFHLAVIRRVEAELHRFAAATERFINGLLQCGMPWDWRERLSDHLAHWEREPPGFVVADRAVLERYILDWANARGIATGLSGAGLSSGNGNELPQDVRPVDSDDSHSNESRYETKFGWFRVIGKFSRSEVAEALYLAAQIMQKDADAEKVQEAIRGYYKSLANNIRSIFREISFDPGYSHRVIHDLEEQHRALVNASTRLQTTFLEKGYGRIAWEGHFGDDRAFFGGEGFQGAKRILLGTQYRGDLQNVTVEAVLSMVSIASLTKFVATLGLARIAAARARSAVVTGVEFGAATPTPLQIEAGEVLRKVTEQELRKLTDEISVAATVLRRRELLASADPGVARMNFGKALERLVGERIESSPKLAEFFVYEGRSRGPDFVGIGRYQGITLDITTATQAGKHFARPYGSDLVIITYQRPPLFP